MNKKKKEKSIDLKDLSNDKQNIDNLYSIYVQNYKEENISFNIDNVISVHKCIIENLKHFQENQNDFYNLLLKLNSNETIILEKMLLK